MSIAFFFSLPLALEAQEAYQSTARAWEAAAQKNWDEVIRLADDTEMTWGAKAKAQNSELSAYPKGDEASKYALLNELATVTYLKGNALLKKGENDAALVAFNKILSDYNYGQCWDPKGWWWKPATIAQDIVDQHTSKTFDLETPPLKPELKLPGKKGVCFALRDPESEAGKTRGGTWDKNLPKVSALKPYWNYSWGKRIVPGQDPSIEFVPMVWGADSTSDIQTEIVPHIQSGRVRRVMGFNEPDHPEQATMTYQAAIDLWPMLESLGVPLVSPACANPLGRIQDESAQGVSGTWMRDFMREADKRGLRIDYIGAHWYGGANAANFKKQMIEIYKKYGERPLIISEFAPAHWPAKTAADNPHTESEVLAFMKDVIPWMEKQNWIAGYAWYSFAEDSHQGANSAMFDLEGRLTPLGRFYASVTNENPEGDQSITVSQSKDLGMTDAEGSGLEKANPTP